MPEKKRIKSGVVALEVKVPGHTLVTDLLTGESVRLARTHKGRAWCRMDSGTFQYLWFEAEIKPRPASGIAGGKRLVTMQKKKTRSYRVLHEEGRVDERSQARLWKPYFQDLMRRYRQ